MAELRIELPTVVTVLASGAACDRIEAPSDASLLRVARGEVMLIGAGATSTVVDEPTALVADVSDAWVAFGIEGEDAPEVLARLSELALPPEGWIQGEVAHAAAKLLVEPVRITVLVPAMLATHVEERIRIDAAEVLTS